MASGSFTKQVGNRNYAENEYIKVWWESTPDPENNRSKVHVWAKMYRPWSLAVDFNQDIEYWINGEKYTTSRYGWRGSGWTKAYLDKTVYVPHNDEGKKTVKIRVRTQVKAWLDDYVGWVDTGYQKCKLDNLDRKSEISVDKAVATLGETIKVTLRRSSSKVRHTIVLKIGDQKFYILKKDNDDGKTNEFSYTLSPEELLPYMASQTVSASVIVKTYLDSTGLGTNNRSISLNIRRNVDKPSLNVSDIHVQPVHISNNFTSEYFIQNKSKANIIINPTTALGDAGAIKTYTVSINGVSANYNTNNITIENVLGVAGRNKITVEVIDGRGVRSDPVHYEFNVLPWGAPLILNFNVSRCLADGTLNKSGAYAKVSFDYKFYNCNQDNDVNIEISVRNPLNGENFTLKKVWSSNSASSGDIINEATGSISEVLNGTFSIDNSFEFKLRIYDTLGGTAEYYENISTEELLIDLYEKGVAVGKVVERTTDNGVFEVGWDAYFDGIIYGNVQTNVSDVRNKLLVDNDINKLLDIWDKLSVVLFKYRDSDNKILAGLIAQDVISIFSANGLDWRDYGVVYDDPATGYYSINYEFINQLSMLKVKMVQSQLNDLAERVAKLEK